MFRKLNLFVIGALLGAVVFTSPVSADDGTCGITVESFGYFCEYRSWDTPKPIRREGLCTNGDTLVLQMWLAPGCWNETGVVTATAMEGTYGYNLSWLNRPRYVRFSGRTQKYVEVRLQGIYQWTENADDTFKLIAIQITPVSSQNAAIADDAVFYMGWNAGVIDGGGKG